MADGREGRTIVLQRPSRSRTRSPSPRPRRTPRSRSTSPIPPTLPSPVPPTAAPPQPVPKPPSPPQIRISPPRSPSPQASPPSSPEPSPPSPPQPPPQSPPHSPPSSPHSPPSPEYSLPPSPKSTPSTPPQSPSPKFTRCSPPSPGPSPEPSPPPSTSPLLPLHEEPSAARSRNTNLVENSFQVMKRGVRKRATKTLKSVVKYLAEQSTIVSEYVPIADEEQSIPLRKKATQNILSPEKHLITYPVGIEPPPMSKTLQQGSEIGSMMTSKFLFPGLPKIVGDIWVFVELFITVFQLVFSLVNTQYASNKVFNSIYITLSSINVTLSLIDGFLYFYDLHSCKFCYRLVKGQWTQDDEDVEDNTSNCCRCIPIPKKVIETFNQWFEVIRSVLGELLIYPLVVLDLFELLGGGTFHPTNSQNRVSFGLFFIGSFYLVLSVYIGRTVMSASTIYSLRGLTSVTTNSSSYTRVFIRFLFHVIGQIFVHFLCIVAVGIKIWQEDKSLNGGDYIATPFLWSVIIGGWVLPFLGVISFFVVNYYWLQHASLGVFVDMVGLLQEPDFAEAVFQGKNQIAEEANEKAKKLLEDVKYDEVKEEAIERENVTTILGKLVYPLKVPLFILFGLLYDTVVGGFIACLLLEYDKYNNIVVIDVTDSTGIATLVTIGLIVIANVHAIVLINMWMAVITFSSILVTLCTPVYIIGGIVLLIRKYRQRKESDVYAALL